jgi:TPR repeat protein
MNIVNESVLHRLHSVRLVRLVRSLGRCIIVSILVLVSASALAGEFLEAETLRKAGFYTDAFPIYMRLAEAGNAPAQNAVGLMLQGGLGTAENLESSVVWLKRSAEQGYAPAQSNLGAAYRYGRGTPEDFISSVQWLRRAADEGSPTAMYNLGVMIHQGKGTEVNDVEALKWFLLAREFGHKDGAHNVAATAELVDSVGQRWAESAANEWLELYRQKMGSRPAKSEQ